LAIEVVLPTPLTPTIMITRDAARRITGVPVAVAPSQELDHRLAQELAGPALGV
jgi:hypothetical protein